MSNIFLKNDFASIFSSLTESNIQLPKHISIIDNNAKNMTEQNGGEVTSEMSVNRLRELLASETPKRSRAHTRQRGGAFSATSSAMNTAVQQRGGKYSATSSEYGVKQQGGSYSATSSDMNTAIRQCGGSFSATSAVQRGGSDSVNQDFSKLVSMLTSESNSATDTVVLENELTNLLKQSGGAKTNVNDIKQFFLDLKSQGVDVNVKLNDKTMTEFFDLSNNTTTEIGNNDLLGGGKTNPGFQAFLDFKKYVAEKLKVTNSPNVGKIAGMIQREMKEKHSNLSAVEIAEKGKEHFDNNKSKYESEYNKLLKSKK
jgi:hypothetical protein